MTSPGERGAPGERGTSLEARRPKGERGTSRGNLPPGGAVRSDDHPVSGLDRGATSIAVGLAVALWVIDRRVPALVIAVAWTLLWWRDCGRRWRGCHG